MALSLLAEHHDIFSLGSCELDCTDLACHVIKVMDDKPFKERFRWIPPPMVKEVLANVKKMLEYAQYALVRAPGVTQFLGSERRTGVCTFALTSANSMHT